MAGGPAIHVANLSKRFRIPLERNRSLKYRFSHPWSRGGHRELMALKDVSFDIAPGEFVGIVGHNGSGKSTLLKILSGIYRQTSGEVVVNGPSSPFLELGVGFNPELTARENVHLNGAILGLSRDELERRMDEILAFAELEGFENQKLKNYSSGMQVRLAFTVAIQAEADILLMDEVLAVGDAAFQAKCFDVFARYRREGKTVVLVTHDLAAVDTHCDRAILFDHGELVADGPATKVTAQYRRRVGEAQGAINTFTPEQLGALDRWGTGSIVFSSVRFLDGQGRERGDFETSRPFSIEFTLHAEEDVDDLVVGFALHVGDGTLLAGTNTHVEGFSLPAVRAGDDLVLRYNVAGLRLLTGSYRLTASAHPVVHSRTYDHLEQQFKFSVSDTGTHTGLFDLGGEYELVPAESRSRVVGS